MLNYLFVITFALFALSSAYSVGQIVLIPGAYDPKTSIVSSGAPVAFSVYFPDSEPFPTTVEVCRYCDGLSSLCEVVSTNQVVSMPAVEADDVSYRCSLRAYADDAKITSSPTFIHEYGVASIALNVISPSLDPPRSVFGMDPIRVMVTGLTKRGNPINGIPHSLAIFCRPSTVGAAWSFVSRTYGTVGSESSISPTPAIKDKDCRIEAALWSAGSVRTASHTFVGSAVSDCISDFAVSAPSAMQYPNNFEVFTAFDLRVDTDSTAVFVRVKYELTCRSSAGEITKKGSIPQTSIFNINEKMHQIVDSGFYAPVMSNLYAWHGAGCSVTFQVAVIENVADTSTPDSDLNWHKGVTSFALLTSLSATNHNASVPSEIVVFQSIKQDRTYIYPMRYTVNGNTVTATTTSDNNKYISFRRFSMTPDNQIFVAYGENDSNVKSATYAYNEPLTSHMNGSFLYSYINIWVTPKESGTYKFFLTSQANALTASMQVEGTKLTGNQSFGQCDQYLSWFKWYCRATSYIADTFNSATPVFMQEGRTYRIFIQMHMRSNEYVRFVAQKVNSTDFSVVSDDAIRDNFLTINSPTTYSTYGDNFPLTQFPEWQLHSAGTVPGLPTSGYLATVHDNNNSKQMATDMSFGMIRASVGTTPPPAYGDPEFILSDVSFDATTPPKYLEEATEVTLANATNAAVFGVIISSSTGTVTGINVTYTADSKNNNGCPQVTRPVIPAGTLQTIVFPAPGKTTLYCKYNISVSNPAIKDFTHSVLLIQNEYKAPSDDTPMATLAPVFDATYPENPYYDVNVPLVAIGAAFERTSRFQIVQPKTTTDNVDYMVSCVDKNGNSTPGEVVSVVSGVPATVPRPSLSSNMKCAVIISYKSKTSQTDYFTLMSSGAAPPDVGDEANIVSATNIPKILAQQTNRIDPAVSTAVICGVTTLIGCVILTWASRSTIVAFERLRLARKWVDVANEYADYDDEEEVGDGLIDEINLELHHEDDDGSHHGYSIPSE